MRLWSLHPAYLDSKGLVAVWREGLLALHVLKGQTKGYRNHPQLLRFKYHAQPIAAITAYLHGVADEAQLRQFSFSREKLDAYQHVEQIPVTLGQIEFEWSHLQKKLFLRDKARFLRYDQIIDFEVHPFFRVVPGKIESWEKVPHVDDL